MPRKGKRQKYKLQDIPRLRYGIIHSQIGFSDGVSIVIDQIEQTLRRRRKIPRSQFYYLVGKAKQKGQQIYTDQKLWHNHPINKVMLQQYQEGLSPETSAQIEEQITSVQETITTFITEHNIDILIVHNSSHPVNFISSVALSRYYKEAHKAGKETPKYILWWHDSHLERDRFSSPHPTIRNYLFEGVPGPYVDYIIFINSLQFRNAERYFLELDSYHKGYYQKILSHHDIVYNTSERSITSYKDLKKRKDTTLEEEFLNDFKITTLLQKHNLKLSDVQFVLQHTRIVARKRIEFAIEYCYSLYTQLQAKEEKKALILFISGHSGDELDDYKKRLKEIYTGITKKDPFAQFFLIFAEDHDSTLSFEQIPKIIASLDGIATFFSEVEGFGNNLLEVMAGGLIPIVYTYPVFVSDIEQKGIKAIKLRTFDVDQKSLTETVGLIHNPKKKQAWVNTNLKIITKYFSHKLLSRKIARAIIRKRTPLP